MGSGQTQIVDIETHHARTVDETHVDHQVTGEGPIDIVLLRGWVTDIEYGCEKPVLARVQRGLGSIGRLIRFDRRGMGFSDRVHDPAPPTVEERMDDIRVTMVPGAYH